MQVHVDFLNITEIMTPFIFSKLYILVMFKYRYHLFYVEIYMSLEKRFVDRDVFPFHCNILVVCY